MTGVANIDKSPSPINIHAFPKTCGNCKKVFLTEIEFFQTSLLPHWPADIKVIQNHETNNHGDFLEISRNYSCGSALKEMFHCRRDLTEKGIRKRQEFQRMLDALVKSGYQREVAREKIFEFIDLVSII
jgi:hypothetical protein